MSAAWSGSLLETLAVHVPYILLGGQSWLDVDGEEVFVEAVEMAAAMRNSRGI